MGRAVATRRMEQAMSETPIRSYREMERTAQ